MVDACLRCNQTLYYWKIPILTGHHQWCCAILEVKNIPKLANNSMHQHKLITHHENWG